MTDIAARAALVPAANVGEALTTSVSRLEIEDVLESDEAPIELVLDVTRFSDGEAAETRSVAISWERPDLERLLKEAQGDQVVLTFDREALRQAMEAEVEAHGLREKVIILAVAATAATGGAAATAQASPGLAPGLHGAVAQSAATQDDRAVSRTTPTAPVASLSADDRAVARAAPTSDPVLGADDRAVPRATPIPEPVLGPDDRAVPRATPSPEPVLGPDDRAVPRATPAPEPVLGVDDRAVPRTTPVPTSVAQPVLGPDDRAVPRAAPTTAPAPATGNVSDPGITWAPSPAETAALAGAIALAITGAFFLVGGRRRVRPGPA
jgi:hypothetical protein